MVRTAVGQVANRLTSFANNVPAVPGAGGMTVPYPLPRDKRQQQILNSREALGGRTTYYAGPVPSYISTYGGGLTAARIKSIHQEVLIAGWMVNKASLDEEMMLTDAHVNSVDGSFRDEICGNESTIEPCDDTPEARDVADYLNAAISQIDSYQESCRRLLFGNAGGYALEEAVFDDTPQPLNCLVGGKQVTVWGYHPRQRQWVSNKHTRWDVAEERLLLDMGFGKFVSLPAHKFVRYDASSDFQARRGGYLYPNSWLHLIKTNAIARWAAVLEIWGIPVPWGKVDYALWQDQTRRSEYEQILRDAGRGRPFLATDDLDIQKAFDLSDGDARGMHAALIGWVNSEQSKLIQGETLTTEIGGVGSYNASETHAETKESRVANCARRLAETERRWYREVLKLACYLINDDGSYAGVNPRGLCAILNRSPEQIIQKCGIPYWRIQREMTPAARMDLFVKAVNELGLPVDESQPYKEFGLKRPRKPEAMLKGKAQVVGDTDRVAPSITEAVPPGLQKPASSSEVAASVGGGGGLELTATDLATIITVNEARQAKGLKPLGEDGNLTLAEYKAKHSSVIAEATAASES